ncbi:M15 family metallopeptidase [Phaeocystidibacter luteus]|nr:M15 family metallopeptidase [Phaeocystidibacter luteus]
MHAKLLFASLLIFLTSCSETPKYPYGIAPVSDVEEYEKSIQKSPSNRFVDLENELNLARFDIRYATANNFTSEIIYPEAAAWTRIDVAKSLSQIEDSLAKHGLGLIIFDAYRPYAATVKFYQVYKDTNYVASPYSGSRHNRGCAIDLSLYDLKTGRELQMPTKYDDFSSAAHQTTESPDSTAQYNKVFLRKVMTEFGFEVYNYEWWHFDYSGWDQYEIMDLSFAQLKSSSAD